MLKVTVLGGSIISLIIIISSSISISISIIVIIISMYFITLRPLDVGA